MTTKIQVKTVVNGKERHVELERGQLSFQQLKSELTRKTQQRGQWYIRAAGKTINNDNDLKDAIVEAEKRGDNYLNVDIVGGSAPAPTARATTTQTAVARPAATQAQPAASPAYNVQATPAYTVQPTPVPVVQSAGVITSLYVPGDPAGGDRPRVNTQQESTAYIFTPAPSQVGTRVEISLEHSKKLQFKMTQDNGKIQTQTFNIPFDVTAEDISLAGNKIVLTFPF